MLRERIKQIIPRAIREPLVKRLRVRPVQWGSLRRLNPVSRLFGFDRGVSIDRYYIETFLQRNSRDIRGRVMEIADPRYTKAFGSDQVTLSEVLHFHPGNPRATLVGDLATGEGIPDTAFDCMIITQTFHCIYDIRSAVVGTHKALKPGGILLATLPGISQISRYDMDRWGDYWRVTDASARRLFGDVFGAENIAVEAYGNVLTSVAFLHGLSANELTREELSYRDPDYQLLVSIRAVKPEALP